MSSTAVNAEARKSRSFGFGSVAAATITLATTAGSSPSLIAAAITRPKVCRCCA
jgi:hypothetical protein